MLGPFCEDNRVVFRCPLDSTRHPVEGLSYEYQPRVAGKTLDELRENKLGLPLTEIWLVYDFDPVHGPEPCTRATTCTPTGTSSECLVQTRRKVIIHSRSDPMHAFTVHPQKTEPSPPSTRSRAAGGGAWPRSPCF